MRKASLALLSLIVAGLSFGTSQAYTCQGHPSSGGCKDTGGDIHCGSRGELVPGLPVRQYANNNGTSSGEIEVCSDSGAPNQQGRVIVQGDASKGVRVTLDTDKDQPFPSGWITVQVSPDHPGVWCNRSPGKFDPDNSQDPVTTSDGYAHGWSNPGTDGGADQKALNCAPSPPTP
jgi:hypothetical protein